VPADSIAAASRGEVRGRASARVGCMVVMADSVRSGAGRRFPNPRRFAITLR
jgi:hypothetical protein